MILDSAVQLDALDFQRGAGLLAVVAQHAHTGEVLMLAWANREALQRTLDDGVMWYYSRSRDRLWRKGETSGNVQRLVSLHGDCDGDAVVARVLPSGPSCHTGDWSCFAAPPTLAALDAVIAARATEKGSSTSSSEASSGGGSSYTQRLLADGNLRLKKLGEEAVELALACERGDADRAAEEAADLLYHALVACRAAGVPAAAVLAALERRRSTGGGAGSVPAAGPVPAAAPDRSTAPASGADAPPDVSGAGAPGAGDTGPAG
jgi:phosphoribosyl-AMP cyclohydrolase / phosphoribosyl-ATP pyrophosphohydrolase